MIKKIVRAVLALLLAVLVIAGSYLAYVVLSYSRIGDYEVLEPEGSASEAVLPAGSTLRIVTQNCGFSAYTPDFTFFMDGGTQSWANSRESVIQCISEAAETARKVDPDFVLFQEVDTDSTRSYHVDQRRQLEEALPDMAGVFAFNYHSAFLMYPVTQPHGKSNSGLLTLSRYPVSSALRRSLEISSGFSKLLDLDRCYSLSRIPVDNGKELVLYNVHLSAYGGSDAIRTSQITQLMTDMLSEYEAGNYCVCGGDFNHDFTGDSSQVLNGGSGSEVDWARPFPTDLLPEGISQCLDYDDETLIPTCRNCDVPAGPDCKVYVVDGFLVSANVEPISLHNIDTGFSYSDHQPAAMEFTLKE